MSRPARAVRLSGIEDDLRDFGIVEEWTAAQAIPGYSNSSATSASTPFHSKCPVGDATVELRCPPERLPRFSHSSRARPARGKPAGSNVQPGKTAGLTRPSSRLWKVHVASVDQIFKPGKQRFDIGIETIGCEAGAGGTVNAKSAKQRLRAVVAAAQGHSMAVEVTANLLCREAFDHEGYDPAAITGINRPEHMHASDCR